MLRGKPTTQATEPAVPAPPCAGHTGLPSIDQAFATEDRPHGILFYQQGESFFLPYHLLHSMQWGAAGLTLLFPTEDVILTGRGLHELYIQLAAHRVSRIVEQGERFAAISEDPVLVCKIQRVPKESGK